MEQHDEVVSWPRENIAITTDRLWPQYSPGEPHLAAAAMRSHTISSCQSATASKCHCAGSTGSQT